MLPGSSLANALISISSTMSIAGRSETL
uniref:NcrX n=1 Tax=Hafnia alvei TaxID=569 RepID=Q8VTR2_HAFAL|nr:NcrX [Hafnia alvei]